MLQSSYVTLSQGPCLTSIQCYTPHKCFDYAFFQLEAERSTHEIFLLVESFLCQCNATSYFTFASAVLGHHTSKVAELWDWLQFFTVDHYSQLPILPPCHSHNSGLFHIYLHVVFLWRLLKSTLGMRDHSLVIWKTDRFYQHTSNFSLFLYIFKPFVYDMLDVDVKHYWRQWTALSYSLPNLTTTW